MADDSRASDVGARYARALFDLSVETGVLDTVEGDLKSIRTILADSADFRTLATSPRFSADKVSPNVTRLVAEPMIDTRGVRKSCDIEESSAERSCSVSLITLASSIELA